MKMPTSPLNKITVTLLLLLITARIFSQAHLQRSVPEDEAVSSAGIIDFLDAAAKSKNEFHSFMFLRHGKVVAEGWWNPYADSLRHTMYSTSKSFTSTAVGFAVAEKKFTVSDKVVSFFPGDLPDTVSAYLAQLKVKDLLTMSVGQKPDPTFSVISKDNWVKAFLALPILDTPGTKFLYNSLATFMLSAIVQKQTGEKVIDYLRPRLFQPLGIEGADWEMNPEGINSGGWGLRVKTEDMAKLGQLYLQKGNWQGKQLLPEEWVAEATGPQIQQAPDSSEAVKSSNDWMQGYGYQFWRCRHDAFRADGAFGQFIIVMPALDAVVVFTAETADMQDEINLVWNHLLPAIKQEKLPADEKSVSILKQKLAGLSLLLPAGGADPSVASKISEKAFKMEVNDQKLESISFQFKNNTCHLNLVKDNVAYPLNFGNGKWMDGTTEKPLPALTSTAKGDSPALKISEVAGSYFWKDENTLSLILRYKESPHKETMLCHFDNDTVSVMMENSVDVLMNKKAVLIKGTLK